VLLDCCSLDAHASSDFGGEKKVQEGRVADCMCVLNFSVQREISENLASTFGVDAMLAHEVKFCQIATQWYTQTNL
jgi:hypothetical protein